MGGSEESEDVTKTECAVCKGVAKSRCGGCQIVSYCSREHQKLHWREHKGECIAWKITESPELGRYLTAVRDIKQGEIIIREKPLLITPPKITLPLCLGCYSEFRGDGAETDDGKGVRPYECRNGCGWPMCKSSSCSNSKDHESECKIGKARGKVTIRNADLEHPIYQAIGILRSIGLKEKDPDAFEKLMSLEANTEKRKEFRKAMEAEQRELGAGGTGSSSSDGQGGISGSQEITPEVSLKLIREFFKREDATEDWMLKLIGLIETNGHEIPLPDASNGHINRRVIGVYHISSFLEHNCKPNCVKTWELPGKEIVIRSSTAIKKGDHLSISYVDPLWGTNDRVNLLRITKFFTCKCERCLDPTELGCHISSLRCQHLKCMKVGVGSSDSKSRILPKEGLIVPQDPYKPETDWKCVTCAEDYNVTYVSSLIQKAGQEMEELQAKIGDISAKEEFLKRFSKTLSPNHFFLLEIKVELAQLYGRTSDELLHMLSPQKLLRKIQLCEELVILLNIITPGYNRLRALILYELQAAVFTLSRLRRSVGEISLEKHLEELMQCGKWMTEVIKVLGWESQNSIERRRAEGAQRDLEALRVAVLSLQQDPESPILIQGPSQSSSAGQSNDKDKSSPTLSVDQESFIEEVF